jgi:predicted SprT family Zn-dependent metalloprotease
MSPPLGDTAATKRQISKVLRYCERVWSAPDLASSVTVQISSRLKSSLGRCSPATGRVSLHPLLADAPRSLFAAVLCHELAHVIAYRRFNRSAAPHGPEWQTLVRTAGFDPAVAIPYPTSPVKKQKSQARYAFAHICPVCQTRRFARRGIRRWRCAECQAAGLSGELEITTMDNQK